MNKHFLKYAKAVYIPMQSLDELTPGHYECSACRGYLTGLIRHVTCPTCGAILDWNENKKTDIFNGYPIHRVHLNGLTRYKLENDGDDHTHTISIKIMVELIQKEEDYVIDRILECARENGVSVLYLIDRDFVLDALKHEIERRKNVQQ